MWNDFAWFAGVFFLFMGIGYIAAGLYYKLTEARKKRKFTRYLNRIRKEAEAYVDRMKKRHISELYLRDKQGKMFCVNIIIDSNEDDVTASKEEFEQMIKAGEAGTIRDLMNGKVRHNDAMKEVNDFVFTPDSVREFRAQGMEPDQVVTMMLRSVGRID